MASATALAVARTLVQLPASDHEFLYNQLVRLLQPKVSPQAVVDIREKRFANGFACPRCGSTHIHRHGKYKNRWRYRCVNCRKTFNDATASTHGGDPLQHECLVAVRLVHEPGISVPTAFYWRHKILSGIRQLPKPTLIGIVEADETFFLDSQ